MKKIGLVIQGPLLSIGRTGDKMHESVEELKAQGGIVEYDCRDNIQKIVDEFGYLFEKIVVSTWDNEVKPSDSWHGVKLVSQPDPGGIKQTGHYKDNNKYRQFLSTLKGLKEFDGTGIEYAVKIRTDIHLDLKTLIDSFFLKTEGKESNVIGVTVTHSPTFLLHDLYFIARLDVLKDFCESILDFDRFEFISSVHREMLLKHAYGKYKKEIGVPDWAYFPTFPPGGICVSTRKIFDYMFKNVYLNLDPEIFRRTLWRNTYFPEEHISSLVNLKSKGRKYNLPALICIDWGRYFNFLLETSGRKITFRDKFKMKIGESGWLLWNFIRKTGRNLVGVIR